MQRKHLYILLLILILVIVVLLYLDPIPQPLAYHNFADQRTIFGIPNFWNVASNIPMFFLGVYGLYLSCKNWVSRPDFTAKWIPIVLCAGIFLACFGSMYYHYAPDNHTLVWDRLPMTLMFMPILSLVIYDFMGAQAGKLAFFVLVPLGVFSIFYWDYTESIGAGDLRLYGFVQFFPMVIAPFLYWFAPKKVPYGKYILLILGWYILTKLAEHFDPEIYHLLGFWSGHTIKHLLGSVTLFYVLKLVVDWEKELLKIQKPELSIHANFAKNKK